MANKLNRNPIVLDTFSSIINFAKQFPDGMKINSIEWSKPTSTDHTFTILAGGASGPEVFAEQCYVATASIMKQFNGAWLDPLYFAVAAGNEKASGKIIITLEQEVPQNF